MDVVERLTLDAAAGDTVLARAHTHRYEFASRLCSSRRVLDLCCGSGYGSAILATEADHVLGVDNDAKTIAIAQAAIKRRTPNAEFQCADAVSFLRGDVLGRYDVLVCFEGLEHLREFDAAMDLLRHYADAGLQIVASIPNSKLFDERNPFHVIDFGYDEACRAFAEFPSAVMLPQYLADGSLICPAGAGDVEVTVVLGERDEVEYANHFIFCVNFDPAEINEVHHGNIQASASPVFNRWAEGLKHTVDVLQSENARLMRRHLGKAGSASAAALATDRDRRIELAVDRQRRDSAVRVGDEDRTTRAGEDPNSWQERNRRARQALIPWIEQTMPLAGRTLLQYGCGAAPVSCAAAERAEHVIGVDIDPEAIEKGLPEVSRLGYENIELHFHDAGSILDAVSAYSGEVDVFLCYAVLEHLTVSERLDVLRLAREVVKPDGAIVVCESPNRLVYFDHHTAQMPFFHLLPDELAALYYSHSPREDFRAEMEAAAQTGAAALVQKLARWGRGVSFHEFELVFGDLTKYVIASNYDPLLFAERPVQREEVMLARYLESWRPDLAPVWSRYWLDLILSARPLQTPPSFLRPWAAHTVYSRNIGWTQDDQLSLPGPNGTLVVNLDRTTSRIVVGVVADPARQVVLSAWNASSRQPVTAEAPAGSEQPRFLSFNLREPALEVALTANRACKVIFVGFED